MPRSGSGKVTVKDMLVGEVAKTDFVVGGGGSGDSGRRCHGCL